MKPGEKFELECLNYLIKNFETKNITFKNNNIYDSTKSDIEVIMNGISKFYIEVKDSKAQSGQFVLLSDDKNKKFIFSPRNKDVPNKFTNKIISQMNKHFEKYNLAGTSPQTININSNLLMKWIVTHYKNRNVKYVISKKSEIFICPIEKFSKYFNVRANFRIKKSGSTEPSYKDFKDITDILRNKFNIIDIYVKTVNGKKKIFVKAPMPFSKIKFNFKNYNYYFSPQNQESHFEIKKLSNTNNRNVIFTIETKRDQQNSDLEIFKKDLL